LVNSGMYILTVPLLYPWGGSRGGFIYKHFWTGKVYIPSRIHVRMDEFSKDVDFTKGRAGLHPVDKNGQYVSPKKTSKRNRVSY